MSGAPRRRNAGRGPRGFGKGSIHVCLWLPPVGGAHMRVGTPYIRSRFWALNKA
ncbi:hypothetical protein SSCG_03991 [Streptomyces clavuligerus]|nr:hypothetical protein SSCG_03991 [Streptomyces clavuligerus]